MSSCCSTSSFLFSPLLLSHNDRLKALEAKKQSLFWSNWSECVKKKKGKELHDQSNDPESFAHADWDEASVLM